MSKNWLGARSFEETNLNVLENEILCDITFLAGKDKQEVKAHKVILASRSPVFYNMFCGSLAEANDVIEIPDVEEDILKLLLRFLYTEECQILPQTVMGLLYGAKKYDMKRLVEKCKRYLETELSTETVCLILQHAYQFDEDDLMKKSLDFIFNNAEEILKSKGIRPLCRELLRRIIESDHLYANENDIYEACKDWASEQLRQKHDHEYSASEIREELGDLIFLIRCPLMDPKLFTMHVSKEDILTPDEKIMIFQSFHDETSRPSMISKFSIVPRNGLPHLSKVTISRFEEKSYSTDWSNSSQQYGINFKVSNTVICAGVSMFTPSTEGSISGTLALLENDIVLSESEVEMKYQEGHFEKAILFENIITLHPSKIYTVRQRMNGVKSYHGKNGKALCTCENLGIEVEFSNCGRGYLYATNINQGQIHGLLLCKDIYLKGH